MLSTDARLVWTVSARSHLEAMQRYYAHMGWGEYSTDFPEIDGRPYVQSVEAEDERMDE